MDWLSATLEMGMQAYNNKFIYLYCISVSNFLVAFHIFHCEQVSKEVSKMSFLLHFLVSIIEITFQ